MRAGVPGGGDFSCSFRYFMMMENHVITTGPGRGGAATREPVRGNQVQQAMQTLRIATRKSQLAMWQAEHVRDRLMEVHPELKVELVALSTRGDQILDTPLAKVGGKGLFVKELEEAMLDGRADIAVHSMKDVPCSFPRVSACR